MIKFENIILRHSNEALSMRIGFNKIQQMANEKSPLAQSQLANKQLYLRYVEEVLTNKESELIKWEKQLNTKQRELSEEELEKNLGIYVHMAEEIKLVEKKIKIMHEKYVLSLRKESKSGDFTQYSKLIVQLDQQSSKFKQQIEEALKKQFINVVEERKNLRTQISQFSELNAYEKYLNQLHDALERRSEELVKRQEELSNVEEQQRTNLSPNSIKRENKNQSFSQNQSQVGDNQSGRKRARIFNTKLVSHKHELSWGTQNDTFASHKKPQIKKQYNQSSQIMDQCSMQNSKDKQYNVSFRKQNDSIQQMNQYCSVASKNRFISDKNIPLHDSSPYLKDNSTNISMGVQADQQNANEAGQRLRKQGLILKYAKKLILSCVEGNATHQKAKRSMAVHLWRMNTCYDETIPPRAVEEMKGLDNLYEKPFKNLAAKKLFPYNKLSLNRKKYVELMFDFQRKRYRRVQISKSLRSILVNKHRKERLTFLFYFLKFYRNTGKPLEYEQTFRKIPTSTQKKDEFSHKSSHVFYEEKPNKPVGGKTNLSSIASSSQKALNKSRTGSNSDIGKQNLNRSYSSNKLDEKKLKQFIIEKERTEKLLATQCVKLEGIVKMSVVLAVSSSRQLGNAFRQIKGNQIEEKVEEIGTHMAGLDFKLDMVLTKCRLGLANNSNKISSLEHLLGIANTYK